jgi:hypothetical protein
MAAFGLILCVSVLVLVVATFYEQVALYKRDNLDDFVVAAALSFIGFLVTYYFVPIVKEIMLRNDMWGYDINKNGRENNIRMCVMSVSSSKVPTNIFNPPFRRTTRSLLLFSLVQTL